MTHEAKQLLLKDLCARLPYGVYVVDINKNDEKISTAYIIYNIDIRFPFPKDCSSIKPYLRPMSSMTKEEDKEWQHYKNGIAESSDELLDNKIDELHDWFYRKHLDFRGLISLGLALEALEGMYKTE